MPIVVENLTVGFAEDQPLLREVSMRIDDGEFVIVLGTSGSGKSLFSLCLNGIVPHVIEAHMQGSVSVNGRDTTKTPVSELATHVGLVFQDPDAQLIAIHVEDEIVFGPENLMFERDEIGRRLEYALEMVGMQEYRDVHTWGLSGGQKQRVAIGSVLSMRPSILVLDEPTSNLDPEGTRAVFELLARLQRETNMTIVAIEHKLDALIEHVDRLLVFDQGRLIHNGPPQEIIARHGRDLVAKGVNLPQVAELGLAGLEQGLPPRDGSLPLTVDQARARWPIAPFRSPPRNARPNAASEPLIRFDRVSFSYPNRDPALRDIDLAIAPGEFLAIVGQNGAGKTTLTKLIVGLLKASQGKVTLAGEDVARMPIKRLTEKVGYVFQYPDNQLVTDTVFDEVAFSMRIRNQPEDEVRAKVHEVLRTMELQHLVDRHPLTLSMGEKRRLSVATMLVLDQKVLILDEPTMGMDWGHVVSIMRICQALQAQGRTILMVTHDMRVVGEWADRVVAMARGQMLLDAAPRDFFLNEAVLSAARLTQLPVCPWRDCRQDAQARCASCTTEMLSALLRQHAAATREVLP